MGNARSKQNRSKKVAYAYDNCEKNSDDAPEISNAMNASISIPLNLSISPTTGFAFRPEDFKRLNEDPDDEFYSVARFVQHTDDRFRSKLGEIYKQTLATATEQAKGVTVILDLCSSWDSHLPSDLENIQVTGHGMNESELNANRRLEGYFIQDLNKNPCLSSLASFSFDAVLCCCGIQYLTKPVELLAEVRRILRPGGVVIISFSSHCFAEKAVALWLDRERLHERSQLVVQYLHAAGFGDSSTSGIQIDYMDDDNLPGLSDPVAVVIARKQQPLGVARARGCENPENVPMALMEMELRGGVLKTKVADATIERWEQAYKQMMADAHALGIPLSAIPKLPENPSENDIKSARDHLSAMIASFVSSGL